MTSPQRLKEDQKGAGQGGSGTRAGPGQTSTELRCGQDRRSGVTWGRMLGNQVEASSLDKKGWECLLWLGCSPGSPAPEMPSTASFLPG